MATTFTVYLCLAIFNFIGSIVQGVAGIGDAIFLQVLWYMAYTADPEQFGSTPLGSDPVAAVALLMYVRLLFMAPLVVYLGLSDSIFSRSMTIMMAVPSTILSIIGVYLFKLLDGKGAVLKLVLGISSLLFAVMYAFILLARSIGKRRKVAAMKEKHVKVVVEADAIAEEAHADLATSVANLHASFTGQASNSSFLIMQPPAHYRGASPITAGPSTVVGRREHVDGDTIPVDAHGPELDPETGLPIGTTEAFVSTITGQPFIASEAAAPQPTEDNVPQLTPSKLSPSRTMAFTRVRVNRNLDANGKIKMSTKIGAAVAASASGLMASLTGVNAPPQIIFILLYDAPNYIVRVNFSAQSIPSSLIRFFMAIGIGKFTSAQIPIFITSVIFGYAGVFAGNAVGRLLGPKSFNIFVLCLLLLSSLVMVIKSVGLLAFCTVTAMLLTVAVAVWERRKNAPIIEKQAEAEMEIEKRMYDVMEELHRNNSFIAPSSVDEQMFQRRQEAQRPKPMWGNFDNDDDSHPTTGGSHGGSALTQHIEPQQQRKEDIVGELSDPHPVPVADKAAPLANDSLAEQPTTASASAVNASMRTCSTPEDSPVPADRCQGKSAPPTAAVEDNEGRDIHTEAHRYEDGSADNSEDDLK